MSEKNVMKMNDEQIMNFIDYYGKEEVLWNTKDSWSLIDFHFLTHIHYHVRERAACVYNLYSANMSMNDNEVLAFLECSDLEFDDDLTMILPNQRENILSELSESEGDEEPS